jgi:tetratricopeptide (TPR) repeat protein
MTIRLIRSTMKIKPSALRSPALVALLVLLALPLMNQTISLAQQESSYDTSIRTGQALHAKGQFAESRAQFEAALQAATTDAQKAEALIGVARTQLAQKNQPAVQAAVDQVLALTQAQPDQSGRAMIVSAEAWMGAYKWLPARQALEKAFALEGASGTVKANARYNLGRICDAYSDAPGSEGHYAAALSFPDIDPAIKLLAQPAYVRSAMQLRNYAKAREVIADLLTNPAAPSDVRVSMLISQAKASYFEGDIPTARKLFTDLSVNKDATEAVRAEAQLYIGLSYFQTKDNAQGQAELQKVLAMPGSGNRPTAHAGRLPNIPAREAAVQLHLRNLATEPANQSPAPKILKVLFIGSSHTARGDVPGLVTQLAASAPADRPRIATSDYLRMGTTISMFWQLGDSPESPRGVIAADPWDVVVFENFYTLKAEDVLKFGKLLSDAIQARGARAVIYESPCGKTSPYPDRFNQYHQQSLALRKEINAPLAAAVPAWMRYLGPQQPTDAQFAELYDDNIHASATGAYFSACSIYAAITGTSPVGLFFPPNIPEEKARTFQKYAWEAYLEANPQVAR